MPVRAASFRFPADEVEADETGSELGLFEIVDDSAHHVVFAFRFAACWGPAVGEGPAWQWDKSVLV